MNPASPNPSESAVEAKASAAAKPRASVMGSSFSALIQFARFMFSLPWLLLRGQHGGTVDEITVYSAHPSFFLWALIFVGFTLGTIVHFWSDAAGVCGWIYVFVMLYFLITLLYDFSAKWLALWLLIFGALWLLEKYIEAYRDWALLGHVSDYLASLHPRLDPGMANVLSWLLLVPWLGSLVQMAINGRKRFTPNEIGEFHFGEGSELTDRTGLRFRTKYRDVLETLLTFGGGDLLAVDNHQNVIKRWDNIIGLAFIWKDLDHILHQRSVVDEDADPPTKET